ncbi:hypothetical protein PQX77_017472 [Marasmius sp. AFHP31]|nr:hypothetical protein PQX77_017472 [Marasmius sp. AFHP31]
MFTELPVETVLLTVGYLSIPSIHSLELVTKRFHDLIVANKSTVYRSAALFHNFIPSAKIEIDQLGTLDLPNGILEGMKREWKAFCQRMFQLDKNWRGLGPSALVCYPSAGIKPACVRADEKEGFVVNVQDVRGFDPGLIVVDKAGGGILWKQRWDFVQTYVIEYHLGYLVLNTPGWREVWRLATIPDPYPPSPAEQGSFPYPQPSQSEISEDAFETYQATYPKGHFVPHAAFPYGSSARAFRMMFPTLLSVHDEGEIHIYDVPSRRLIQKVLLRTDAMVHPSLGYALPSLGTIWTIDSSSNHIFLTSADSGSVRVFERSTGRWILDMGCDDYGERTLKCIETESGGMHDSAAVVRSRVVELEAEERSQLQSYDFSEGSGSKKLRVSRCGNHFVTLNSRLITPGTHTCQLVIVRNFPEIPPGDADEMSRHTAQIVLGVPHATFDFDGHRRVFVGKENGVLILDISKYLASTGEIEALSIPAFTRGSRVFTCEVTDSGVYFDWNVNRVDWAAWDMNERRKGDDGLRRAVDRSSHVFGVDFGTWDD